MSLLNLLEKRLDDLERERTASTHQNLRYGGAWLCLPISMALGFFSIKYCRAWWDTAGAFTLWLALVLFVTAFGFAGSVYQRRVPIKLQLVIDLIAWALFAWMLFHFKFWDL